MKTVCPQCHTDGHHKMSCSDESNPGRKDRMNLNMSLKEPIVEGAWYLLEDNHIAGQALQCGECGTYRICGFEYRANGDACLGSPRKIRQVHFVPTDPAEVVAELRRRSAEARYGATHEDGGEYGSGVAKGLQEAKVFVAEKLGVES